jgi:large subunit ribosomal protein L15
MRLEDLRPAKGSTKKRKRRGRGPSSGSGKTSGKGHKGLKARSGGGARPGFEGGQMPLYRRLPKRGFLPYGGKTDFAVVNVKDLSARFAAGSVVDPDGLVEAGLIKKSGRRAVKVLGDGDIAHALTVKAHRISEGAKQKLEAAGGRIEVLLAPRREAAAGKGGAGSARREARSAERSAATTKREAPTTKREAATT